MPLTSDSRSISVSSASAGHSRRIERARDEMAREIAQVDRLALRTGRRGAASASACVPTRAGSSATGVPPSAGRSDEAVPDRLRRLDRDLLSDDRARQRGERIAATHEVDAGKCADRALQHGSRAASVARRGVPVRRLHARDHACARRRARAAATPTPHGSASAMRTAPNPSVGQRQPRAARVRRRAACPAAPSSANSAGIHSTEARRRRQRQRRAAARRGTNRRPYS